MAKTINKILALALMTLLCMTVVTALESDDEKEEPAENPNNEEFPDEKDNLKFLISDGDNINILRRKI